MLALTLGTLMDHHWSGTSGKPCTTPPPRVKHDHPTSPTQVDERLVTPHKRPLIGTKSPRPVRPWPPSLHRVYTAKASLYRFFALHTVCWPDGIQGAGRPLSGRCFS